MDKKTFRFISVILFVSLRIGAAVPAFGTHGPVCRASGRLRRLYAGHLHTAAK